jgi:hypothetical protein
MVDELKNTGNENDGEPFIAPKNLSGDWSSLVAFLSNPLLSEMSIPILAVHCLRELNHYRRGEPYTDIYGVELFRRATMQDDQEAWAAVQRCFSGIVRDWFRSHPSRETACHLESEDYYVTQAFERFWQTAASSQCVEFNRLSTALQYLRTSLQGAILETLRDYARPVGVSLPVSGEPRVEDGTDGCEVWDTLKTILSNPREQRLAYLLFQSGLKPREIVSYCPHEFSEVHEIYRLRRNILDRLLCNVDSLQ